MVIVVGEFADMAIEAGFEAMLNGEPDFEDIVTEEHDFGPKGYGLVHKDHRRTCKYCGEGGLYWAQLAGGNWRLAAVYGTDVVLHECLKDKLIGKEKDVAITFNVGDVVRCKSGSKTSRVGKLYIVQRLNYDNCGTDFPRLRGFECNETDKPGWYYFDKFEFVKKGIAAGQIVERTGPTSSGSNGRVEKGKRYKVLGSQVSDNGMIKLALFKNKSGEIENYNWVGDRFKVVNEKETNVAKRKAGEDYEIVDKSFEELSNGAKQRILKGHIWACPCDCRFRAEEDAADCCDAEEIYYIEMPDCYYWSRSKDKPVLIAEMLSIHLVNAIRKLRREGGEYVHLLSALEAEASRRNLSLDSPVDDEDEDDDDI